ncbi:MAG: L-threonylcarbamoyladenylate synthase [Halobacteriales archaeon]|nr:L-threonylcarbamoyladenylate synthase [Halobacteriales archaeon]
MIDEGELDAAAAAIRDGELVVYPTETVYGLAADALDPTAVERVFAAKDRPSDRPISLAAPSVEAALGYVRADDRTRELMDQFLPGPVTVVAPKAPEVPDALTAGHDRVGVRVPDHPVALELLERVAPLTATSANVSGGPSVREPAELDGALLEAVAVVLDAGRTPGGESTVVDPERDVIHRRGREADAVEAWLAER